MYSITQQGTKALVPVYYLHLGNKILRGHADDFIPSCDDLDRSIQAQLTVIDNHIYWLPKVKFVYKIVGLEIINNKS